ncbi:alpha-1,2 glucosyltransferase ALG10 [Verticillium dahliae VdLs.17]|uniref:Dol-P-Glc:Glc(2)Man(9)GlcNAc(2)-PP-Dol alpha-1,2-glucosyltransferase n=1 Tax=Verticillium dahliae (strain VdLs.17 / ATCC MYA-4575 / FGSC 10137) TaxID=498257 RepID=G2XCL1_VERDV|nr:alpha-1,2 glucosyltransferase ALG10 [Verticillium dahliae VdLs.17]EGY16729.1 alpha-1,2 glucosyltransferase ALG10 [Verticillium dahliae VdLs.17]
MTVTEILGSTSLVAATILWLLFGRKYNTIQSSATSVMAAGLMVYGCASIWLNLVNSFVPDPYLVRTNVRPPGKRPETNMNQDEFFHIPQAQVYCKNKFTDWDDKITTPPGLYLLSRFLISLGALITRTTVDEACKAGDLRLHNAFALFGVVVCAAYCRHHIEAQHRAISGRQPLKSVSTYSLMTGVNIALFPVLFFFSGLYYTDVVSTLVVLVAYVNHMNRVGRPANGVLNDIYTITLGVSALSLRQTNIFWVVVYMGGLEAVHAIRLLKPKVEVQRCMYKLTEYLEHFTRRSSLGDIHDLPLNLAWPHNLCFSALSIGVAVVCNPMQVLQWVWPHVSIMACFLSFIAWNGSVVLGDKSNHVATIHLPQMLYIWPFFAFFSVPLFLPSALGALRVIRKIFQSRSNKASAPKEAQRTEHYVFYIFRYTILASSWLRELFTFAYLFCFRLCWAALAPCSPAVDMAWTQDCSDYGFDVDETPPYTCHPFWGLVCTNQSLENKKRPDFTQNPDEISSKPTNKENPEDERAMRPNGDQAPQSSTVILLLVATTLSLMTAPLVEPRYFILPWVFWRLLVPAWRAHEHTVAGEEPVHRVLGLDWFFAWGRRVDLRVVVETLWFVAINVVTMAIFLLKPYVWRAEDGTILDEGRLQRFMW